MFALNRQIASRELLVPCYLLRWGASSARYGQEACIHDLSFRSRPALTFVNFIERRRKRFAATVEARRVAAGLKSLIPRYRNIGQRVERTLKSFASEPAIQSENNGSGAVNVHR